MNVYENAIKAAEEYLSELCSLDAAEHIPEGSYRVVFNNWEGRCESTVLIYIDQGTMRLIYKMYYNGAKLKNEEQKTALTEYFHRIDKTMIRERCTGGIEDNGAVFVKVEHSCILYGLSCEQLYEIQRICTERIFDDRADIKKYLRG